MATELDIKPLTPDRIGDLASLFDQGGDPKWCWCSYYRLRSLDFGSSTPASNRAVLENAVADGVTSGRAPGLIAGVIFMAIIGGSWKRRLITFGSAFVAAGGMLALLGFTNWFAAPSIGIVGVIITGIGAAVGVTALSTGLANRRTLYASLITVGIWAALYYPLQYLFFYVPTGWMLFLLGLVAIGLGSLLSRRKIRHSQAVKTVLRPKNGGRCLRFSPRIWEPIRATRRRQSTEPPIA